MHYTINPAAQTAQQQFVPGHSLGEGYTRHIVQIERGDTADNPASTKGPIYGPAFLVYDCSPMSTNVTAYEDAGGFYDAVVEFANQKAHRKLREAANRASEERDGADGYNILSEAVDDLIDRV